MALDSLSKVTSSGISTTSNFKIQGLEQGITVGGIVTATSFVGDGSGLSGVVGSGSGVIVKDDGALVGTAGTINFGSNLSVSAISAGIVTVTGTDTNTTYTQAAVADGSNVNLRLTGSDSTIDDILLTAGTNITFSSVTAGGLTISASGGGGGGGSIAGIDTSGTSTFTNLNVTGVSTFAGITTVTGPTLFVKQLNASGVVTASSFSGSASGLTNIPAGQLTGALPAIDGSALINIIGSGSGVIVRDSGTVVGTAGTIDFGDNLTVSAVSAGIVTVTASSGATQFVTTAAGIHTLSKVGIGTTNPVGSLQVGAGTSTFIVTTRAGSSPPGSASVGIGTNNPIGANLAIVDNSFASFSIGQAPDGSGIDHLGIYYSGGTGPVPPLNGMANIFTSNGDIRFDVDCGVGAGNPTSQILFGQGGLGGGGVTWVSINSSGNVGIGTTLPTNTLTVVGSGTSTSQLFVTGVSTFAGIATVTGTTLFAKQLNVSGVVTASSFSGSASGLTGIPAGQLTGALPALDGSALTGIVASGTGIVIREEGTTIGTAGTINFVGAGVTATFSSGIATVSITSGVAGIDTSGTSTFTNLNVTGVTTVAAGSTAAPSISPTGDSNTGIFFPAADTIAFGEGGSEALRIDSSGNLGIGTDNPATPLQVERYGVKTTLGTFNATAGVAVDIDSFTISVTDFKTAEYTLHIQHANGIQAQKVLVMQNGTTAYSNEYAIMYTTANPLVSVSSTISSGACKLKVTPKTGVNGTTTYRFSRETLL